MVSRLPNHASNGTYNYITTNLSKQQPVSGSADASITRGQRQRHRIFGSYSIERGSSGVPQNEYYSARGA